MGLFWGTLLILIDLNVGAGGFRIDLVPDIIGWILISDGVENIFSRDSKRNEFLRVIHGMEVMAVIQILIGIAGVSDYQNPEFIYRLYEGLRVAKALAWIFVLGIILKEFKLLELENEKFWNASSLKKTFSFFSITSICASLLLPLCIYSNRLWGFCATALLVGISAILFLVDLYQACKYWKEDHED